MGKIIYKILEENWQDRDILEKEVEEKFKLWDSKKNSNNPEDLELLLDTTIWAYSHLLDKSGAPLKLRGFQNIVVCDPNRFIAVAAANQIGKTWACACIKAIHHALYVNNASVIILSKSEDQAIYVLDEIKWILKRSNKWNDNLNAGIDNRTEIHIYGPDEVSVSVIRALPPTTSALSYPCTLMIGDEIAFWLLMIKGIDTQTDFYDQVMEPRTNETKNWKNPDFTMGQIILISNPWGQIGKLWHAFDEDDRFNCYQFCWLANPKNTYEEFMSAKKRLPRDRFDSVYAAKFSSGSGGFITENEWRIATSNPDIELLMEDGITISLGGDYAGEDTKGRDVDINTMYGVKVIKREGEPAKVRLCYQKWWEKRTKKEVVYNEISRIKETNPINLYAYDKVGVGDSVKNDLIDKNILSSYQIESLTYSLPNKSEVYYNLKHLFEQGRIEIPKATDERLKRQLLGLKFEQSPGGFIKIHHATEKIKDDDADAFANACYAALRLIKGEISVSYVEEGEMKKSKEFIKRVVCLRCEEDWDYIDEEECPFCGVDRKSIAHYSTHIPI